jgi:protein dithiol:quinone oxidoreductase
MTPSRYPSIPWPWVGLILCLALLGQEYLLLARGADASLSAYRIAVMTVGVTSLALLALPPRRIGYILGFVVCAGLMAFALYLQYAQDLEPCPLCIFQRIAVVAMGLVFLIAAIHNPGRFGAGVYAVLQLIFGGAGTALASRQVWLQSLPKDQVPVCGMSLSYMLDTLPFTETLRKVLEGSGECAEKSWELLHVSIAGWTLVFFVTMVAASFALIRRD